MKVADLLDALKWLPTDAKVSLDVYGHRYDSECDRRSHGPVVVVRITPDNVLIATDTGHRLRKFYEGRIAFVDGEQPGAPAEKS